MAEDMGQIHERWRYNVFLSFRGEDVRNGFLSHLYESLVRSGIHTFMDDEELKRGENISPELLKAIENSEILLVVLSENYASSAWCLDELVHIMECRESDTGQMVFPIFYNVEPGDLRRQKRSFGESFDKHKNDYPESKLLKWRAALTQVANMAGVPIYGNSNEAKMIDRVIREILQRLPSSYLHLPTYSVGIRSRVHRFYKLMCFGSNDVQVIGICGMGGIGKTMLAKAAYNEFSHRFEGTSFLENFGEYSTKPEGKVYLQRKLLSDILRRHGKVYNNMDHDVRQRFRKKRVLVVLDDVKDIKQIDSAAIDLACFGPGSRIIITCRNTHLLAQLGVEHIYSPEKLDGCESLELLSWHAFRRSEPPEAFLQLSDKLVKYCGGLPLAMEILGAFLFKRNTSQWRSTLELLKQTPNADIQAKLQISFDALDPEQKEIFLDISCFFIGMDKDYVSCILDGCKLYPDIGLTVLKERCLITVCDNRLVMHDLLRDMGRNIVRGTSRNSCERWSRLWDPADVIDVLANNYGTDAIEGLSLKAGVTGVENLEVKAFSNLRKLRLLQLSCVQVKGNFAHFPRGLRWFCWFEFPLDFIPTTLHLESLVVMDLQDSNLKRFWDDQKQPQLLKRLKYLDLSHSVQLTETPDFSYLPNLETLLLINCKRLVLVHKSIGTLHNTLVLLNMEGCTKLGDLPLELYTLKSLETLILSGCSQLERLPRDFGELENLVTLRVDNCKMLKRLPESFGDLKSLRHLYMWETLVAELPESFGELENLVTLRVDNCKMLKRLPESFGDLKSLRHLYMRETLVAELPESFGELEDLVTLRVDNCKMLKRLPESFGDLKSLRHLYMRENLVTELPESFGELENLVTLRVDNCKMLKRLPESFGDLKSLRHLYMRETLVAELPESFGELENLVTLRVDNCKMLKRLPESFGDLKSLRHLYMRETLVTELPESFGELENLVTLRVDNCKMLKRLPESFGDLKSLRHLYMRETLVAELPESFGELENLVTLRVDNCKMLKRLPESFGDLKSLRHLYMRETLVAELPESFGELENLVTLRVDNCKMLKRLPESFGDLKSLHHLYMRETLVAELPESFGELENLVKLRVDNCKMLKRLPESFGDLKSLRHLYMQETLVAELPESFGNLSNLRKLEMQKKPLFRISESDSPGTSEEPRFVDVPNSLSNLVLLEELDARSCRIWGKIPDDFEKLLSMKILNLGNNYFHSLPSSLEGLSNLRELSLYDCRELECVPPLPWKLEQLNLANCFALESISDLSKLEILHDLNLTNCEKVVDIPGLEHLTALERLYMSGCNSSCSLAVKKRLSKVSLKMMRNLTLPGNRIPDWFVQGPVTFSAQPNRELRGVILAVVVALNHETRDDYMLPNVVGVQAQILKLGVPLYTHSLHLSGVPRTNDDQLHICRYSALHPMVTVLKDGYTLQVIKRELPYQQGVVLKMHGIHLVYEGDDDFKSKEHLLIETQLTVPQKLSNFFSSFEEGEVSSEGHMSPQ